MVRIRSATGEAVWKRYLNEIMRIICLWCCVDLSFDVANRHDFLFSRNCQNDAFHFISLLCNGDNRFLCETQRNYSFIPANYLSVVLKNLLFFLLIYGKKNQNQLSPCFTVSQTITQISIYNTRCNENGVCSVAFIFQEALHLIVACNLQLCLHLYIVAI